MDAETPSREKRQRRKAQAHTKSDKETDFCFGSHVPDPTTARTKKTSTRASKEKNFALLRPIRSESPELNRPRKKRIGQNASNYTLPPRRQGFRAEGPERTASEPPPSAAQSDLVRSVEDFEAWNRACDAVEQYRRDRDGLGQIQENYANYLCKAISWDGPLLANSNESKPGMDSASTDALCTAGSGSSSAGGGSGDAASLVLEQGVGQVSALVRRFSSLEIGESGEIYEENSEGGDTAGGAAASSDKNGTAPGSDADLRMVTNVVQGREAGVVTQVIADWVVTDVYQPCDAAVMTEPERGVQTAEVGVMTPASVRTNIAPRAASDSDLVHTTRGGGDGDDDRGHPRRAPSIGRRKGLAWHVISCLLTAVGTVMLMNTGVDLFSVPLCGKRDPLVKTVLKRQPAPRR